MEKTFENIGGNILVRAAGEGRGSCGIVEMLHLWNENESGCVIGAWKVRDVDSTPFPEFYVVHDRLTSTTYSFDILEAIRFGQKMAELLVEMKMKKV